jgi:hypothetical protein
MHAVEPFYLGLLSCISIIFMFFALQCKTIYVYVYYVIHMFVKTQQAYKYLHPKPYI